MVDLVITHRIRDAILIFQSFYPEYPRTRKPDISPHEWNLAKVAWELPSERSLFNAKDKDPTVESEADESAAFENVPPALAKLLKLDPTALSISHIDLINLSKALQQKIKGKLRLRPQNGVFEGSHATKTHIYGPFNLPYLLHGTSVYCPPPENAPKKKTREFLQILERQKRLLEEADYQQLLVDKSAPEMTTVGLNDHQLVADDIAAPSISQQTKEVKHQITTIFNIALSVASVSYAIWYWTKSSAGLGVSARALLSIWGGLLILVAEVVVYGRYVQKVTTARVTERRKKETKHIVSTTEFRPGMEALEFQTEIDEDDCLDTVDFKKGNPLNTVLGSTASTAGQTEPKKRPNRPVF